MQTRSQSRRVASTPAISCSSLLEEQNPEQRSAVGHLEVPLQPQAYHSSATWSNSQATWSSHTPRGLDVTTRPVVQCLMQFPEETAAPPGFDSPPTPVQSSDDAIKSLRQDMNRLMETTAAMAAMLLREPRPSATAAPLASSSVDRRHVEDVREQL